MMGLPETFTSGILPEAAAVAALAGGYTRPGAVWGAPYDPGFAAPFSAINVLCKTTLGDYWRLWMLDGLSSTGAEIRDSAQGTEILPGTPATMLFSVEPSGNESKVWVFGPGWGADPAVVEIYDRTAGTGISLLAPSPLDSGQPLDLSDYGAAADAADFGIDRERDRVFIRTAAMDPGTVAIYEHGSFDLVANITVPDGATVGILPTGEDRMVWLVGASGWLCRYDYDGNPSCAMRNPRPVVTNGFCYGWDRASRRLLLLEATAAGAFRVRGFWPHPAPEAITFSVPLLTPIKNRTIPLLTNVFGDAGEPMASRLAVTTTGPAGTPGPEINVISDQDGDIIRRDTPPTAGASARVAIVTVSGE